MALAMLGPLLGSIAGPSIASSLGLGISSGLASAIGSGLGTWAATGNPLSGLEGGLTGGLLSGVLGGGNSGILGNLLSGGGTGASSGIDLSGALASAGDGPTSILGGAASASPGVTIGAAPAALAGTIPSAIGSVGSALGSTLDPTSMFGPVATAQNPGWFGSLLGGGGIKSLLPILGLSAIGSLFNGAPIDTSTANTPFKSPGLTPYKNQSYVAPPAGYIPGVSPEPYMLSNPNNYAAGGIVAPSQADANSMLALQLGLQPQQILQQQLALQTLRPSQTYAIGGMVHPGQVHLQPLNSSNLPMRETARMAMPFPKPAGFTRPLGFHFDGGGPVPNIGGLAGMPPGMAVPDVAGDGQSDSIPATVDGKAPAMLSSNEFVVPSDAVAHLGNGSSQAGARKLHQMVNRVRMAKTSSAKMPPRINAPAMMPA